ncbi:MAG: aminotransferase class I/II-fold pyridoxal phosphate-dependent enzyme [Fastidiosipilaceae bacterium]|nr:aminotransferase class I/II-fold pyridoxal phosphate-dependent enzyme [Clostridiaceae bacterium]
MLSYKDMDQTQLETTLVELKSNYKKFKDQNLNLNMARGKPSCDQMDMTEDFLFKVIEETEKLESKDGTDCRNYGILEGLPEMREIFSEMMEIDSDKILALGNSSLELMFNVISYSMTQLRPGATKPWYEIKDRKFLCPVPGYDRHFAVTEHFGFELVPVQMTENGPDMDEVERLCAADDSIKGIWCVPKYSNPDGYVYDEETTRRLAKMKAADDFLIMWDNTYCVHHLYDDPAKQGHLLDIMALSEEAGYPDRVLVFASTSKMTFANAGIGAIAGSKSNIDWYLSNLKFQTIGPDKMSQLFQAQLIKKAGGVKELMKRHATILRPKFELVLDVLQEELGEFNIADWHKPLGGYFISVNLQPGTAKQVVAMCKDAGVILTGAGATYPYNKDPHDSNIRIAPSYPTIKELETAIRVFCTCAKIAAVENYLSQ